MLKEALFFERQGDKVRCKLCPRECLMQEGKIGFCRQRINKNQTLYTKIYGEVSSIALDPIEKKPLYHFFPSSFILSVGTIGCSFSCIFCQNWEISQKDSPTEFIQPKELIELAKRYNSIGIAYTYSEPLIWYEYVLDCAKLAKRENLKNVLVTNGFINEKPLRQLLDFIDAANIDLKSISQEFYKKVCSFADLNKVLSTIKIAKDYIFIELTNLIVPTLNDNPGQIIQLIDWIASEVGKDTPLHFSRYFPAYKFNQPQTPTQILLWAYNKAKEKLNYVYLGNIWEKEYNTTYCPSCKKSLIEREGYKITNFKLRRKECEFCGYKINIIL